LTDAIFHIVDNSIDDDNTIEALESLLDNRKLFVGYFIGDLVRATLILLGKRNDYSNVAGDDGGEVELLVKGNMGKAA